jgi:Zn-dependent protease
MQLVFTIAVLVMSVVIHETSHGYAAYYLGDPTAKLLGRLSLNPLRHLDPVGSILVPGVLALMGGFIIGWAKPVPYDPNRLGAGKWGPAIVGAAGPLSNLLIAAVFALALRFMPAGVLSGPATTLWVTVVVINVMLAIFNLIPVAPLDGSKILFALLPYRLRHLEDWFTRYQFVWFILLLVLILNTNILERLVGFVLGIFLG